jgi:methionyl aminopeptidase
MNADPSDICQKMVQCGKQALYEGISNVVYGNTIGTVALAIEEVITRCGYSVVKEFAGHGIGKKMHEDPIVPNYFDKDDISTMKQKIYVGMALAIEPMFCQFDNDLVIDKRDEWTVRTRDGGIAMHIEDTVVLTDNGVVITTQL